MMTMVLGWALITYASLEYFDHEYVPTFVLEKLPVRLERLWLSALDVHVTSALVTFPMCLLLATRFLQRRPQVHRYLGRATALALLLALVPSGVVLAFEAKGGIPGTLGFLLSGGIVFASTVIAVVSARRKELTLHAYAMRHVVAQMSVAVISRAMLIGLDYVGVEPEAAYLWALWVPVVGCALWVEVFFGNKLRARVPVRAVSLI
jgi:hypothetical protein